VPSRQGETSNDLPAEGRRVRGEVESKRVADISDGSGTGGGLDLRQEVAGVASWGFNR
jgi:hypothetical protein